MSKAAKSIVGFAIYMTATGIPLVLAPNMLLGILRLPLTDEPWIRLLGAFLIAVAYYYLRMARSEGTEFFRATVHGRTAMALFMVWLGLTQAGFVLVLFALGEFAGAAWTWIALRSDAQLKA
jgi:hypothetical protein